MKRVLMLMLAATVSTPALAQHEGHGQPAPQAEQQEDEPTSADPHAGHAMPASEAAPASGAACPAWGSPGGCCAGGSGWGITCPA